MGDRGRSWDIVGDHLREVLRAARLHGEAGHAVEHPAQPDLRRALIVRLANRRARRAVGRHLAARERLVRLCAAAEER